MLKLEFDTADKPLVAAIGAALVEYAGKGNQQPPVESVPVEEVKVSVAGTLCQPAQVDETPIQKVDTGSVFAENDAENDAENGVTLAKGLCGQNIPWDARIHANSKATNADGSWKIRKGADRITLVPQVESELLAALAAPAATEQTPPPPAATEQTPPPPAATKVDSFAILLPLVTQAKAAGTLTDEKILEVVSALGLPNFGMLATRPDLIPSAAEALGV